MACGRPPAPTLRVDLRDQARLVGLRVGQPIVAILGEPGDVHSAEAPRVVDVGGDDHDLRVEQVVCRAAHGGRDAPERKR